jgi:hypothetical protein
LVRLDSHTSKSLPGKETGVPAHAVCSEREPFPGLALTLLQVLQTGQAT